MWWGMALRQSLRPREGSSLAPEQGSASDSEPAVPDLLKQCFHLRFTMHAAVVGPVHNMKSSDEQQQLNYNLVQLVTRSSREA